jgi:diacylglycerol kinase family enzyme
MDIALVANAASGSGTDVGSVEQLLASRGARVHTLLPEDLPQRAEAERIVVAGGDGTIGGAAALAARSGLPLAVVPVGTANDFARHLDLPLDAQAAAALAADPAARTTRIDLAWIDDVPFLNAASAGLSVGAAEAAAPFKRVLGPLAYPVGGVAAALRGRTVHVRVRCDGRDCFEGDAWQLTVAGTGAFGAGSEIAVADPHDGQLDVAVMKAGPRARLARHAAGLRNGRLTDQPGVEHVRGAALDVDGPTEWNVDGEARAIASPHFRVDRSALDVVVAS